MNFYELSAMLKIPVDILFEKYLKLFPSVSILDYSVGLNKKEIEQLKNAFGRGNEKNNLQ